MENPIYKWDDLGVPLRLRKPPNYKNQHHLGDLCGSYTTPKQIEPVKCTPSLDRSSFLHFLGAMKWEFEMQL